MNFPLQHDCGTEPYKGEHIHNILCHEDPDFSFCNWHLTMSICVRFCQQNVSLFKLGLEFSICLEQHLDMNLFGILTPGLVDGLGYSKLLQTWERK